MDEGLIKHTKSKKIEKGQGEPVLERQISRIEGRGEETPASAQKRGFASWSNQAKIALVVFFIIIISIVIVKFDISALKELIAQNQKLTIIISFCAMVITGLTLVIPTAPITLLISLLAGPLLAIVITILGNIVTALIHYQLGKQIGDAMNFEEKKANLPFKLGKLPVKSPLFLLIGRGLPGGPKGLSFICGAYGVPLFLYLWTTFVTELFGAVFIAYGGDGLIKLL